MKFIFAFILLILFYQEINSKYTYTYTIEQLFNIFDNLNEEEANLKIIIDSFCAFFKDIYAFYEVAKNPPQPSFDNNYHQKVNIEEGLRKINIKNTNMYKFHQEVKLVFDSFGDQHLNFKKYQFKVESLYFTDPLKLSIRMHEGKPRMFGGVKPDSSDYRHFRNHETLFNIFNCN